MIIKYVPRDDEYRIYSNDCADTPTMTVPADDVYEFTEAFPLRSKEYQLIAYLGYGMITTLSGPCEFINVDK